MNKIRETVSAAAVGLAFLMPLSAQAQTVLNYSHFGPDRGFEAEVLKQFTADVKEATGGEIDIRVTYGGALLSVPESARGVGARVADMATIVMPFTPAETVNYRVVDLPINPTDPWVAVKAANELVATNDIVRGEFDKMNLTHLGNFATTEIVFICNKEVSDIDDLKGAKFRIQPPTSTQFGEFGVVSVSVSVPEVYQALDRGFVVCAQTYLTAVLPFRHYEVAKNILEVHQGEAMSYGVFINKGVFEGLSEANRAALAAAGQAASENYARLALEEIKRARKVLTEEHGVTFHQLAADDQATLDAARSITVDAFKQNANESVLADFLALSEKYQKEFEANGYPWN